MSGTRVLSFSGVQTKEQAAFKLREWLIEISQDRQREVLSTLLAHDDVDVDFVDTILAASADAEALARETYIARVVDLRYARLLHDSDDVDLLDEHVRDDDDDE